jgi:hypothetical protein
VAWQAPGFFTAAVAGLYAYLAVKATYRTFRILPARRADALP